MSNHTRHPSYLPPLDTRSGMMAYDMEPSPKSMQATMDFLASSPLELPLQSSTQRPLPVSPGFALQGSALPYSANMNQQSHLDSLAQQGRALSQAAHYSLAPALMHRDLSIRSEPIMYQRQTTPSASAGRRISHEMLFAPLAQVEENSPDIGVTPQFYFENLAPNPTYVSSTGTNLPFYNTFAGRQSATPSMVTTSTGTEQAPPMTRENSFVLTSPRVDITRMPSSASYADSLAGHAMADFQQSNCSNPFNMPEDLLAVGCGFPNPTTVQYPPLEYQMLLSPTLYPGSVDHAPPGAALMERGDSTCSNKSTSSLANRAREAQKRILQAQSSTSIAPMPQPPSQSPPRATHGKRTAQQDNKAKQKPKHPKLRCIYCNEIPDGFRGDHELRRHISAKHSQIVKKFVCRDARESGIPTRLRPLNPLSRCKACASGKQYNAYYNAAAHLRRTHFRVKPSRGKGATGIGEKRGGKGGGDWPPMPELKAWFVEIEVEVERPVSVVTGDDPPDEASPSPTSASTAHTSTSADSLGQGDFTMSVSYEDEPAQEDSHFSLLAAVDDSDMDMDMLGTSQDSTTSVFQDVGDLGLDVAWLDNISDADLVYPQL